MGRLKLYLSATLLIAVGCLADVNKLDGEVMTFVDFNYDRLTDLIVLSGEEELTFYAAIIDSDRFQNATRMVLKLDDLGRPSAVVNLVGADFDGDSNLDLAVYWRLKDGRTAEVNLTFYWGTPKSTEFRRGNTTLTFIRQPGLVDCDLNGLPDLLGEVLTPDETSKLSCIGVVNRATRQFGNLTFPSGSRLWRGQAAAFVDVTGNSIPDVVAMVNKPTKSITPTFEVWSWNVDKDDWEVDVNIMPNPFVLESEKRLMSFKSADSFKNVQVGQPVYADFDADGRIDQMIPVCTATPCTSPSLYIWSNGTWHITELDLKDPSGTQYSLSTFSGTECKGSIDGLTLKAGDIDQNGFPDIIAPLTDLKSGAKCLTYAFILENVACGSAITCDGWSRLFRVKWTPVLYGVTNVTTVAFVDLKEDGLIDLMIEIISPTGTKETHFVLTEDTSDTCFLKVEVYTYTCLQNCTAASKRDNIGNVAEGSIIPLPGATLWIQRTSPEGDTLFNAAGQLPQAAFRPLSLPYVTFGLDRTTNFVEKLKVSIPYKSSMSRLWSQIIPNSRLYIVPFPPNEPNAWVSRLFVTPSRLILLSFAALATVCAVIVAVIMALHCVEKRADTKEKLQDAHRFHFDAM